MLLDFIPPGTDLKEVFADLYAGSVVGYYDTDTGEMFVLNDGEDPTPAAKYTLAHELIHALQDQAFDLDVFFPEDEENDDLARAKTALVEGDAVVGSSEYVRSFLIRSEIRQIYSSGNDGPDLSRIPPFLFKLLAFPYQQGAVFVTAIHSGTGWDSVDTAYSDPPLSTEHILHPEKYLTGEQPVTITLPDFTAALAPGWETIDEGCLGNSSSPPTWRIASPARGRPTPLNSGEATASHFSATPTKTSLPWYHFPHGTRWRMPRTFSAPVFPTSKPRGRSPWT